MNEFDESLLTAYLDDELTAGQRREVEAELSRRPELNAILDELRFVRGLVANLPRPTMTNNLSEAVMTQLKRESILPPSAKVHLASSLATEAASQVATRVVYRYRRWVVVAASAAVVLVGVLFAVVTPPLRDGFTFNRSRTEKNVTSELPKATKGAQSPSLAAESITVDRLEASDARVELAFSEKASQDPSVASEEKSAARDMAVNSDVSANLPMAPGSSSMKSLPSFNSPAESKVELSAATAGLGSGPGGLPSVDGPVQQEVTGHSNTSERRYVDIAYADKSFLERSGSGEIQLGLNLDQVTSSMRITKRQLQELGFVPETPATPEPIPKAIPTIAGGNGRPPEFEGMNVHESKRSKASFGSRGAKAPERTAVPDQTKAPGPQQTTILLLMTPEKWESLRPHLGKGLIPADSGEGVSAAGGFGEAGNARVTDLGRVPLSKRPPMLVAPPPIAEPRWQWYRLILVE